MLGLSWMKPECTAERPASPINLAFRDRSRRTCKDNSLAGKFVGDARAIEQVPDETRRIGRAIVEEGVDVGL